MLPSRHTVDPSPTHLNHSRGSQSESRGGMPVVRLSKRSRDTLTASDELVSAAATAGPSAAPKRAASPGHPAPGGQARVDASSPSGTSTPVCPTKRVRPTGQPPSGSMHGILLPSDALGQDAPASASGPISASRVAILGAARATTPVTRAEKTHVRNDGVEKLGEEMDKVFALVHGRGLGGRLGRRKAGSGLRNSVVGDEEEVDRREGMDVDP